MLDIVCCFVVHVQTVLILVLRKYSYTTLIIATDYPVFRDVDIGFWHNIYEKRILQESMYYCHSFQSKGQAHFSACGFRLEVYENTSLHFTVHSVIPKLPAPVPDLVRE